MPSPIISLNVIPETDYIDTFISYDNSIVPNETFYIKGIVELDLERPIEVRELYVQFRGTVESVISMADFYYNNECQSKIDDEIPFNKWATMNTYETKFMEYISRNALGQSNATFITVNERVVLINEQTLIPEGKSILPFEIKVNNAHLLPPSVILPHHIIKYHLSSKIKLVSLGERVKVRYWNVRKNSFGGFKKSKHSDEVSTTGAECSASSMLTPPLSPTSTNTANEENDYNFTADIAITPPQYNDANLAFAKAASKAVMNTKRQLLDDHKIIQICRHSYPSMASLYTIPRIRFRGARKDRIKYEVSLATFTCLQKKNLTFKCLFDSVCEDSKISFLEFYLEQTETYPIRAGDYSDEPNKLPDEMVPRFRKLGRKKYDMRHYENGTELEMSLPLVTPQISPRIETTTLKIIHKLRLIIVFADQKKERKMSLSFPVFLGTAPVISNPIIQQHTLPQQHQVHPGQEHDHLFQTPDALNHLEKLPSYTDVLREGNPPSPFLDTFHGEALLLHET